jgi:hypothetical protein
MSGRSRAAVIVARSYQPEPDACEKALELLLRKAAPASRPDSPERRSDEIRAGSSIQETR